MRSGSGGRAPRADLMKVTRRVAVGLNLVVVDGRNGRIYLFFERAQQIKSLLIAFCTGDVTIAFISNYKIITRPILEISQIWRRIASFLIIPLLVWSLPASNCGFTIATICVLSLIHISEPTRRTPISYAVFCLKKKKK